MNEIEKVAARIAPGNFPPRWGFHDDHRHLDKTPEYLPALQQVRGEMEALIEALRIAGALGGSCLQLGIGESDASHEAWRVLFRRVVTIDWAVLADQDVRTKPGADTMALGAIGFAAARGPFDFLFIDAGHDFESVRHDHRYYGQMVRRGGIIAFHDALPRKGYEEVEVWKYLEWLETVRRDTVHRVGDDVGTAWIVQE